MSRRQLTSREGGDRLTAIEVDAPRWPIRQRRMLAAVPYSESGIKFGQRVRVAMREADAGMSDQADSPDVLLELS